MATHLSILAWKIPWMGEPGRLQSLGWKELDMTEWLSTHSICKWYYLSGLPLKVLSHAQSLYFTESSKLNSVPTTKIPAATCFSLSNSKRLMILKNLKLNRSHVTISFAGESEELDFLSCLQHLMLHEKSGKDGVREQTPGSQLTKKSRMNVLEDLWIISHSLVSFWFWQVGGWRCSPKASANPICYFVLKCAVWGFALSYLTPPVSFLIKLVHCYRPHLKTSISTRHCIDHWGPRLLLYKNGVLPQ